MMVKINILVAVLFNLYICYCNAVSLQEQLEHITRRRRENIGIPVDQYRRRSNRRLLGDEGTILGHPSRPSHLPEAEPILPGHTLIKPTLGMLKSAVKFPHKDLDEGSGVYGNFATLGAKYPGTEDRVKYGSFRRTPSDYYLVELPAPPKFSPKSNYLVSALGLEPVNKDDAVLKVMNQLRHEKSHQVHRNLKVRPGDDGDAILEVLNKLRFIKSQRPRETLKKSYLDLDNLLSSYVKEKQNADYNLKQLLKSEDKQPDENSLKNKASRRMIMSSDEIENLKVKQKIAMSLNVNKDEDDEEGSNEEDSDEEEDDSTNTTNLLDKDFFNHVKFKSSAPEFQSLLPGKPEFIGNNIENKWWYFNQDDFVPFSEYEVQPGSDLEDISE